MNPFFVLHFALDSTSWSEESIDWFKCTMKSENFFTSFFHKPHGSSDCVAVDLYTGEYSSTSTVLLPPIDANVAFMMLLVGMASPCPLLQSHTIEHYHEIDAIGCKYLITCFFMLNLRN